MFKSFQYVKQHILYRYIEKSGLKDREREREGNREGKSGF